MRIWLKSVTRISRPLLWTAGGALLVLLALCGLWALSPVNYEPPQPKFLLSFFLLLAFEIGLATLTISFNCWLNLKLSRHERVARKLSEAPASSFLSWPEQETASNEQYA